MVSSPASIESTTSGFVPFRRTHRRLICVDVTTRLTARASAPGCIPPIRRRMYVPARELLPRRGGCVDLDAVQGGTSHRCHHFARTHGLQKVLVGPFGKHPLSHLVNGME